jgi:hypothetical protein
MRPVGIGDVAAVACRDALGCWGWIEAYRDRSDQRFEDEDLELLASVGPSLGSALRRTMYLDGPSGTAEPHGPGVIVLDRALAPVSSTAAARAWIDSFPGAPILAAFGMLPSVIYPAAATARTGTSDGGAHAIVQTIDRRWVTIEAAKLEGRDDGQIAVTLRAATAAETFQLLCRAYALSQRERHVVAALVAGLDTRAITHSSSRATRSRTTSSRCSERPASAAAANCSHGSAAQTRRHRQPEADALPSRRPQRTGSGGLA